MKSNFNILTKLFLSLLVVGFLGCTEPQNDVTEQTTSTAVESESTAESADIAPVDDMDGLKPQSRLSAKRDGLASRMEDGGQEAESHTDDQNLDAVRQDMASIAASAQGFYIKPKQLGGGGQDYSTMTFSSLIFPVDMVTPDGLRAYNSNGTYVIYGRSSSAFILEGYPSGLSGYAPGKGSGSKKFTATVTRDNLTWINNTPAD
jgi:hypothetical protein